MQLLQLFKPKVDVEKLAAEVTALEADKAEVTRRVEEAVPKDKSDPVQMAAWLRKRLELIQMKEVHPVARLAAADGFDEMIDDYARKLKVASQGDKVALAEVSDVKAKIKNLLKDETKRLEKELEQWSDKAETWEEVVSGEGAKWAELKARTLEDVEIAKRRLEMIVPRDKNDMTQWKAYYTQRVDILENSAISVAARIKFTSNKEKNSFSEKYVSLLNALLSSEDVEQEFHKLEAKMEAICRIEAKHLRDKHPQFF